MTRQQLLRRLRVLTAAQSSRSRERSEAEERFGLDSEQERAALERLTDLGAEIEVVEDLLEGIE